jgi:two-component system NtrC family sensor kinase
MQAADSSSSVSNRRILIVDDNEAIQRDFEKILRPIDTGASLRDMERSIFGEGSGASSDPAFELDFASQGEHGCARVQKAVEEGRPYAVAFVDVRMPPGIDGVVATERMWQTDPNLQVVICTAHSDYSWEQMIQRLGRNQRLLILRKPFDGIEVIQLAHALTEKWQLLRDNQRTVEALNLEVKARVEELGAIRERLLHAQKLDALGRLSAGIAHEINNPLAFVTANLRYINDTIRAIEKEHCVEDFGALVEVCDETLIGAERISRIVKDVKVFARAEVAPNIPLRVQPLVEKAVEYVRAEMQGTAKVEVSLSGLPLVLASEQGLIQVLINLIRNAVQAIVPEAPERDVVRVTGKVEGGRVAIDVIDRGTGIAPENLSRLFEPFFTTKPVGKGTGLGLSICHGIVAKLGGELTVTSSLGAGTTFRLALPAAADSDGGGPIELVAPTGKKLVAA